MNSLNRQQLNELIEVLGNLYPEQNAAREMWVRAGGEAGHFYHAPRGYEMWTHNTNNIDIGRRGTPRFANLLRQALKEKPEEAASLQKYLNILEGV